MFPLFLGNSPRTAGRLSQLHRQNDKVRRLCLEQFEERHLLSATFHEPRALVAANITDRSIELTWDAPEKGAASYLVAAQTDANPAEKCSGGALTSETSFALTDLESSAGYYTRVCAVNGNRVSDGVNLRVLTDPLNNNVGLLGNSRDYPHRAAVATNGDRLTVWMNHEDSRWKLYFTTAPPMVARRATFS